MTKFDKSKFNFYGGYLEYTGTYEGKPAKDLFVARFKYSKSPIKMGAFKKFLVENFSVEEYVEMTSGYGVESTPLKVLESRGFTY